MGGVVDSGGSLDIRTYPRRAAIEKAQAELRQEFDVREERRRELEFLENGGNPLDFKVVPASSVSVQSTSLTYQLAEQFVVSEAKGSFALTVSPHGRSVDISGRPGAPLGREPNSADNLLLFNGENVVERERNAVHLSGRASAAPSERSSQLDGRNNAKDSEDLAIFRPGVKRQAYARRNRTRSSRESGHACSTDIVPSAHGNDSAILLSSLHNTRNPKGLLCEAHVGEDQGAVMCNSKTTSPKGKVASKTLVSENQLDAVYAHDVVTDLIKAIAPDESYNRDSQCSQHHQVVDPNPQVLPLHGLKREKERVSVGPTSVASTEKPETSADQINGFVIAKGAENDLQNEGQVNGFGVQNTVTASVTRKGLDSDSSCSPNVDLDSDHCLLLRKVDSSSNGYSKELLSVFEQTPRVPEANGATEYYKSMDFDVQVFAKSDLKPVTRDLNNVGVQVKIEEEICDSRTDLRSTENHLTCVEGVKQDDHLPAKLELKLDNPSDDHSNSIKVDVCSQAGLSWTNSNYDVPSEDALSGRGFRDAPELQNCEENHLKMASKMREDVILEEARIIEANHKIVGELSISNCSLQQHRKSHWDFVLAEMAWLANDYIQERIWKRTAAAQMSHWVAFTGRLKFDEANLSCYQRKVAHTVAKAIMKFWSSAEVHLTSDEFSDHVHGDCKAALFESQKQSHKHLDKLKYPIQGYAVRFLKCNSSSNGCIQAEAPATPDRISDAGILDMSWEDQLSEESLFYTVAPGAMEEYRKSVESQWAEYEKMYSTNQEENESFFFDSGSEFGAQENAYEEDGVTRMYYLLGAFEGSKSSKSGQRKRKNLQKSFAARSYDVTADLPYGHCLDNEVGNQASVLMGKRPSSNPNVGVIPIKQVRIAARQRIVSPFGPGFTGGVQLTNKPDVSSDTSSFQDEQSSLQGGTQLRKTLEVESVADFGKQLLFDGTRISTKPKKKKKTKHLGCRNSLKSPDSGGHINSRKGSAFEQRRQIDSIVPHEQDHSKRRFEGDHFESSGNTVHHINDFQTSVLKGPYNQHTAKKPKLLKRLPDASQEIPTPLTGPFPSPVASQMSNMSNPNKLFKMITNRDRGRKGKALKMHSGESRFGVPWSIFEDQALVVLVHDMGPNWELISDAINSTLQFKCIFRKSNECKERHKILMDRNSGDGADSAEDSGTSQSYPTNLPGIPKGSARQLFQRLQGPMEEDTVKAHFEKIILIWQQLHSHKSQNDNQETKPITLVHKSHVLALSQACANNLSGGTLTPLDLCDATTSSPDVISLGYEGSHAGGLAVPNQQVPLAPILHTSGANPMIAGSSGMVLSNSLPPASSSLNVPARDVQRHAVPRPSSLPIDDQQRMQYNQILPGRNVQPSSLTVSGALPVGTDRGVRVLPGATGMSMMCGMNRGMAIPWPGFQGIGPAGMLNMVSSGNMLSSTGVGMPSPVNIHSGAVSGQGDSMLMPRDAFPMLRPSQNPEDQRRMMMHELQLQVEQGNGQGVAPFNGLSTAFSSPPVQTLPIQQQHQMSPQSHVLSNPHLQGTNHSPQQQAYVIRMAKERHQMQQRLLHQQQRHYRTSNPSIPHAHSASQHAVSSLESSSQIQQQKSAQPVSMPSPYAQHPLTPSSTPMTHVPQAPQRQQHGLPGVSRNPPSSGGLPNQMPKQRQRQQLQQQPRHHPQQQQQSQSQQAKLMKGIGRGSLLMHRNLPLANSHVNGLSAAPGNQVSEKGDQSMHLMQGQGLFSGSNPVQPGKQLVPQPSNQCQQQHKVFPHLMHPSPKQLGQMPENVENSNRGQVPPNSTLLATRQPIPSLPLSISSQQQPSQSQQTTERMLQQNHQTSSDVPTQTSTDQVQINPKSENVAFQSTGNPTALQSTDSNSVVPTLSSASTASQWKAKPLYKTSTATSTPQLPAIENSPQPNSPGAEGMPSSSQGPSCRQFSVSIPIHGYTVGGQNSGQWQQLPSSQQPHESQQQHRQAGQSNPYVQSNFGLG